MDKRQLLRVEQINKSFPGVKALDNVDFDLYEGEVHVLIGENGAGKSTLMKIIAGAYQRDSGNMYVDGKMVHFQNPIHAQEAGVGIIYQEFNLIPDLNVAQNMYLGRYPRRFGLLIDHKELHRKSAEVLESLGLQIDTNAYCGDLGTGQQQMIEVAKALTMDSKILIMDEPTAALTDREIDRLFETIHQLKEKGIGIIYISHRLEEVADIGDRVTVLRDGKLIGTMSIEEAEIPKMVKMMVGREMDSLYAGQDNDREVGEVALRIEDLVSGKRVKSASLDVRTGEIVGLAGLVGAGRTDLARAVFGADKYDSGKVFVFGQEVNPKTPSDMVKMGLGLIPEDRKGQGLCLILPTSENIVLANLRKLFNGFVVKMRKEKQVTNDYIKDLRIATPSIGRIVQYLSGGTQQKVVLAKWLCTNSKIFIFDEPTRGIDVGAKAEIHGLMRELVKNGAAILMISSELPEILGMSDRIFVMREGSVVAEMCRDEATQEKVIAHAMGGA
ncbi:sugar ABC transporter ATP-binding protein [bacterium]|nr:sugar ABC transporter ATP-binding protein [bacterium]